jgi:hypothetical protein
MYSCNATTGQCAEDPSGSLPPGPCIAACKCIMPHNCGQLNGTMACGKPVGGCNVCGTCCQPFLTKQSSCDACFSDPSGCGGKQ